MPGVLSTFSPSVRSNIASTVRADCLLPCPTPRGGGSYPGPDPRIARFGLLAGRGYHTTSVLLRLGSVRVD